MNNCDLFLDNIKQLITVRGFSREPACGKQQQELGLIENGAVAIKDGKIIAIGRKKELACAGYKEAAANYLDANGMIALPGLVDPHTHLVFGGSREDEYAVRLKGADYLEILEQGGGILSTVEATRSTSEETLFHKAKRWSQYLLEMGTTSCEVKSGYGLNLDTEVKQLNVVKRLQKETPLDIIATYLGAHAWPVEYQEDHQGYLDLIVKEVLPVIKEGKLAEFCDVFCEKGVFSRKESRHILKKAAEYGLKAKLHADELYNLGGAELAAELKAVSADHLVVVSKQGIKDMAEAGVVAVMLPATTFMLQKDKFAPAREMIAAGVPLALASDFNPGSSPLGSMLLVISLAVMKMGLEIEEAIIAATINAAHALDRGQLLGSLEKGKQADIILMELENYRQIPYYFGFNTVKKIIKKGQLID